MSEVESHEDVVFGSGAGGRFTQPSPMTESQRTVCDPDVRLKDFAAELTNAVYPLVLRRGLKDSWLKAELGLWKALADTAKKWARRLPPAASPQELKAWREGLLLDLTESAFCIALKNGIKGSLLELELCLYRAVAQVTATCQTLLRIIPPGITPQYIVQYSASLASSQLPAEQRAQPDGPAAAKHLADRAVADDGRAERAGAAEGPTHGDSATDTVPGTGQLDWAVDVPAPSLTEKDVGQVVRLPTIKRPLG